MPASPAAAGLPWFAGGWQGWGAARQVESHQACCQNRLLILPGGGGNEVTHYCCETKPLINGGSPSYGPHSRDRKCIWEDKYPLAQSNARALRRHLQCLEGVSPLRALGQAESRAKGRFRAQERAPTIDNGAI